MRKKVDVNVLFGATAVNCLLAYAMPCRHLDQMSKVFGYPFGWFKVFNDSIGDVILSSTSVNLSYFIGNTVIYYFIILFACKGYRILAEKFSNQLKD